MKSNYFNGLQHVHSELGRKQHGSNPKPEVKFSQLLRQIGKNSKNLYLYFRGRQGQWTQQIFGRLCPIPETSWRLLKLEVLVTHVVGQLETKFQNLYLCFGVCSCVHVTFAYTQHEISTKLCCLFPDYSLVAAQVRGPEQECKIWKKSCYNAVLI